MLYYDATVIYSRNNPYTRNKTCCRASMEAILLLYYTISKDETHIDTYRIHTDTNKFPKIL